MCTLYGDFFGKAIFIVEVDDDSTFFLIRVRFFLLALRNRRRLTLRPGRRRIRRHRRRRGQRRLQHRLRLVEFLFEIGLNVHAALFHGFFFLQDDLFDDFVLVVVLIFVLVVASIAKAAVGNRATSRAFATAHARIASIFLYGAFDFLFVVMNVQDGDAHGFLFGFFDFQCGCG